MPESVNAVALARVFQDTRSYATTLITALIDCYGTEALGWSPATIQLEIEDDFDVDLPRVNFDKLMAAAGIVTSDEFYWRLSRFIAYCNVLSGSAFRSDVFDPATVRECAWGIAEAMLLSPPNRGFSDEIRGYLVEVLRHEGFIAVPSVFRLALGEFAEFQDYGGFPTDDPAGFSMEYGAKLAETRAVDEMVQENLSELFSQITALPLLHGRTDEIKKRGQQLGLLRG